MPITYIPAAPRQPSFGETFAQNLLQYFLQREELNLRRQAANQREREIRISEQASDREGAAFQQQQANAKGAVLSLLQGAGQGDPAATQAISQLPNVQNAVADTALRRMHGFKANVTNAPAAVAAGVRPTPTTPSEIDRARGAAQANQSLARARAEMQRIAREQNDPTILGRFNVAVELSSAGMDASVITNTLPPDARERANTALTVSQIRGAVDERSADAFATRELMRRGIVPEGAPILPGAGSTLLTVMESDNRNRIDWVKQGLDFITGRVGDNASGNSFPFTVGEDGRLVPAAGGAVTVDQAVAEWQTFVRQFAPEDVRAREMARIESGLLAQLATRRQATNLAVQVLRGSPVSDRARSVQQIRESLEGDLTREEIGTVIRDALREVAPDSTAGHR